jgi:hypothetical protein
MGSPERALSGKNSAPIKDGEVLERAKWIQDVIRALSPRRPLPMGVVKAGAEAAVFAGASYVAFDPGIIDDNLQKVTRDAVDEEWLRPEHSNAEIACLRGDAAFIANYLRQQLKPSPRVILIIAWCLLADPALSAEYPMNWRTGPGNRFLRFVVRNGRPPKKKSTAANAVAAIADGDHIALGWYLLAGPHVDDDTRSALAECFHSKGSSKWRLEFSQREGNPCTDLKTDLRQAIIGLTSNRVFEDEDRRRQSDGTRRPHWNDNLTFSHFPILPKILRELKKSASRM